MFGIAWVYLLLTHIDRKKTMLKMENLGHLRNFCNILSSEWGDNKFQYDKSSSDHILPVKV